MLFSQAIEFMYSKTLIFSSLFISVCFSAPVLPAPALVVNGDSLEVAWDGKGTLYAANSPGGTDFSEAAQTSPYQAAVGDVRFFMLMYFFWKQYVDKIFVKRVFVFDQNPIPSSENIMMYSGPGVIPF